MTAPTEPPTGPPPRRPARWWLRWALVAVIVAVATAVAVWPRGGGGQPAAAPPAANLTAQRAKAALPACPHPRAASPAGSAFAGVRVTCAADGTTVDLGSLLSGGPTLVDVWATWCQVCQQELPAIAGYAAGPGAIPVLTVQVDSDQADGLDLLASLGVRLPTVYDGGGAAGRALHLPEGLPAAYLVTADGTATLITDPRVFTSTAEVGQVVARYLAAGSAGRG